MVKMSRALGERSCQNAGWISLKEGGFGSKVTPQDSRKTWQGIMPTVVMRYRYDKKLKWWKQRSVAKHQNLVSMP